MGTLMPPLERKHELEDSEEYTALEDPQKYLALEESPERDSRDEPQLSEFQKYLAFEGIIDGLPSIANWCINIFRDRKPEIISKVFKHAHFTIHNSKSRIAYLQDSIERKRKHHKATEKHTSKEQKENVTLAYEQLEEKLRLARIEGAETIQMVILIAISSELDVDKLIDDLSSQLDNKETSTQLVSLIAPLCEQIDATLFNSLKAFFLSFNNGDLNSIICKFKEAREKVVVDSIVSLAEAFKSGDIPQTESPNIEGAVAEEQDPNIIIAVEDIIEELRNYPSAPQPTKQELMLKLFESAHEHSVPLELLTPIFDDAKDAERQVQRRIPDLNRRLEKYGWRIERPTVYRVIPFSPPPTQA